MKSQTIFGVAPIAAALLLGGCASTGNDSVAQGAGLDEEQIVVVENHGWETVRVYAVRNSTRMRIGTVEGNNTARFKLRPGMVTPQGFVRLLLSPIAGTQDHVTEPIAVWQGGVIHLNVQDRVQMSSLSMLPQGVRR